jgi:asparagine synthase (glutamine-hydrolysing)
MVSLWQKPDELVFRGNAYDTIIDDTNLQETLPDPVDWMMAMDFRSYLPDDILTKVDRATMAVSLEARIPLLDHRIIEFAAGLHRSQQMQRGTGKLLLRKLLYKHVPRALIDRPKQGFAVPIGEWLRGPLREWAEALLDTNILKTNALNPAPIRAAWNMHIQAKEDLSAQLWTVLMYQAWRQEGAA